MNIADVEQIDLCASLLTEMQKLEFSEQAMAKMKSNYYFVHAQREQGQSQRSFLTLALNSIFLDGPEVAPSNIRLALNVAHDTNGWLTDMKIVILPFLKANQEKFFT